MKFIGQYIQDFIARFRSDGYLEDISTGTIGSGGNLGLDSNNKIVKNTVGGGGTTDLTSDVTGILPVANGGTGQNSLGSVNISDLNNDSGFTSNTGDITEVRISESSNVRTVSSGSATINFAEGEGIDVASAALGANTVQLTISGEDASTSNKGVASFSSDNFAASSGEITIKSGGVDLTDEVTGTLPVAKGGTGLTSISTLLNSNVTTISGNAGTATALATERDLQVDLSSTSADGFDGSGNATDIGVKNTLAVGNGGTGVTSLGSINISSFNNDSGFTANTGDITGVTAGTNLTGGGDTGAVTINLADASTSFKGAVELATTGEADTGTDTTRAVTPAGLKSHVDARFTNQIFSFTFSDMNYVSDTWTTPSQHGPTFYSWNNRHGSGQTQSSSHAPSAVQLSPTASTISVDYLDQGAGIVIPVASKFVGFYGNCRTNNTTPNTARPVFAIFRAPETANDNNVDIDATCIAFDSFDTATGNRKNRFMKLENFPSTPVDLAQGDILFPAIGLDETMSNNTGDILGSFTIVLRTLIP